MVKTVLPLPSNPEFDKKYKTIIKCRYTNQYTEMVDWVDKNSKEYVDVKITKMPGEDFTSAFFAFVDEDDAIFFKIKYTNNDNKSSYR